MSDPRPTIEATRADFAQMDAAQLASTISAAIFGMWMDHETQRALVAEIQSRLNQLEGIKMADSPWHRFSERMPPDDPPLLLHGYIRGAHEWIVLSRGFKATEDVFQWRIKERKADWKWMLIPEEEQ